MSEEILNTDIRNTSKLLFRRAELFVGAAILALPLLYMLTDLSIHPFLWRYSKRALLKITLYGGCYIVFLSTYMLILPRKLENIRSMCILVLLSIVTSLILAEVVLQWRDNAPYENTDNIGRHAPDPDVGHIYYPNFEQVIQTREWRQAWRSNAQGVRADRDYGSKPRGVYRILVVGDSFTVGDQVSLEETYPGVIQRRFDEEFGWGAVELINAGFPGYGTVNEMRWLRKFGRQFEPDLVLLGMTPNDLGENLYPLRVIAKNGAMVPSRSTDQDFKRWKERDRWYSLPGWTDRSLLIQRLYAVSLVRLLTLGYVYTHRHAYMIEQDKESLKRYALAEKYLVEARDEAHAMGAKFAFIIIPFREQLGNLRTGLDPWVFGQRFTAFGEKHDIPVLDLLSAFRAHPEPSSLYWREDPHCTAEGYALIGNETFNFLMVQGKKLGLPAHLRVNRLLVTPVSY